MYGFSQLAIMFAVVVIASVHMCGLVDATVG